MKINTSILTTITVLYSAICLAQVNKINTPDKLADFKLKGKIKTMHVFVKDFYDQDSVITNPIDWNQETILKFNTKGYLTEKTIFLKTPYYKEIYHYNNHNQVVEKEEWTYYKNEWRKSTGVYHYNKKGLVEKVVYQLKDRIVTKAFIYDKNDNVIQQNTLQNNNTKPSNYITYTYDTQNNLLERIEYSGSLVFNKRTFKYDKANNLTEEQVFGYSVEELHGKYAYQYNDNNQHIVTNIYSTRNPEEVIFTNKIKYNDQEDVTLIEEFNGDTLESVKTVKYKFDKAQNHIEVAKYKENKLENLVKSEITYYE